MDKKLTRKEAINKMVQFYESIPLEASSYHKMDFLLRFMERKLGILPPASHSFQDQVHSNCAWEEEPEDDELL